jgi:hypothetical protein
VNCLTSTVLKTESSHVKVTLLRVDELKPHEKGSSLYLELLKKEILKDGVLKYPIIADENTHVILDGMHRWLALKSLGYELIPVILVDAFNNLKIRVGRRRIHRYTNGVDEKISVRQVISAGVSGHLMEPRSTRHFFPFSKFQEVNCPLHLLKKSASQEVSKYLSNMTDEQCSLSIGQWLGEIQEELEFLSKRTREVEREREEFLNRTKSLADGF